VKNTPKSAVNICLIGLFIGTYPAQWW